MNKIDEALDVIEKAIELDKDKDLSLFKKSYFLYQKKAYEKAIEKIRKAERFPNINCN